MLPHVLITQSAEIARAFQTNIPIVALESTVITHGLPHPQNIQLARDMEAAIRYRLHYTIAKDLKDVTTEDLFHAVSLVIKDAAVDNLLESRRRFAEQDAKRGYSLRLQLRLWSQIFFISDFQ